MKGANYRHLGGALMTDHGRITLAAARGLAAFYAQEVLANIALGAPHAAHECGIRSRTLVDVVAAATAWRRAAGWADPDMADQGDANRR